MFGGVPDAIAVRGVPDHDVVPMICAHRGSQLAALALLVLICTPCASLAQSSLRFFGQAVPNANRVMIKVDPHVPVDIGASDFTIEFWMKARAADNTPSTPCRSGSGENWITGNIIIDRAIWEHDRYGDYGLAMFRAADGVAALGFGMFQGGTGHAFGVCGSRNVGDGRWHHVAITRDAGNGIVRLFVDGQIDVEGEGPKGDVSYADGVASRVPSYIKLDADNYLAIGAEKFDADGVRYPSYNGYLDELRFSTVIRYARAFAAPSGPFVPDASTAALYHFDEARGATIVDSAAGGKSGGELRYGGEPAGPVRTTETPFTLSAQSGLTANPPRQVH
jgi:hypothetical protein